MGFGSLIGGFFVMRKVVSVRDSDFDEELLLDDLPGFNNSRDVRKLRDKLLQDIDEDEMLEQMSPEETAFMIGVNIAQAGDGYDV